MNFLAHLYLSDGSPESLLGSVMGDFVKGPLGDRYTDGIRRAIALHRRIDAFTDAHAQVRASRRRISASRRRLAGIMVDMVYDHFLARHWADYSSIPLDVFAESAYAVLWGERERMPDRMQRVVTAMVDHDWLTSYQHIDAIDTALNRMSQRLKRENALVNSAEELVWNYDALEADFRVFFPDLASFAAVGESPGASFVVPVGTYLP